MKRILFTLLTVMICLFSNAQKFEKYYGGPGNDYGVDIAVLSDQSIVSVGTSNSCGNGGSDIVVTKTDSAGVLLWSRYLGGAYNDLGKSITVSTNDDIYVTGVLMGVAAGTEDILVSKISRDGVVIWTKTYGGTNTDFMNDMVFKNNKIYLIGNTKSFGLGQNDIYIMSLDTAGTVITTKTIGTTADDLATSISKTTDGNFLIGGRSNFDISSEVFVAKINLTGDTLWTKRFDCNINTPISSNTNVTSNAVIELTDKQILVTGTGKLSSSFLSCFHIRLDSLGNFIYIKSFNTGTYTIGLDAIPTTNGGYIICADYFFTTSKFDKAGATVWSSNYQNTYYSLAGGYQEGALCGKLAKLTGGRYLFTGTGFIPNGTKDIYIAKLDSNGKAYTNPDPVITPGGPLTICQGDSVLLTAPSGYTTYQWVKAASGVYNKTYYAVNARNFYAKDPGGYLCVLTRSTGTRLTPFITLNVNQFPTTTIATSGATNFCAASGKSVTLTATAGYTSYEWKLGGVPIVGAISNSYIANATGNYTVTLTNNCGVRNSLPVAIVANTPPTCTLTCAEPYFAPCHPPGAIISNDNGTVSTYNWYNGNSLVGTTTVNYYYPNSSTYCIASNACGTATSNTIIVGYNSCCRDISTSGPTSGCGVNSVVLTAPLQISSFFQWYFNSTLIPGATSSTYTATSTGDYYVNYYYAINCPYNSNITSIVIDTNSIANITATSGTSACSGTLPLTVNVSGTGVTYAWYKDNVLVSGTTATYQAAASGTYYCRVYRPSCGYQNSNSITINIGAPQFSNPLSTATICQGGSKNIAVTSNYSGFSFQWYLNGNLIAGATASNYNASLPGTYNCVVSNACSTLTSTNCVINLIPLIAPVITTTGNTNLCPGQTCALNTPLISGGYYYWYNGTNYAASGTNLNTYNASTAGNFKVVVTDPNGCSGTSSTVAITSSKIPTASKPFATDYPLICYGSPLLLKGTSINNGTYTWYKNNIQITGAIDSMYTTTSNGEFKYQVTNSCGTAMSDTILVRAKSKPIATITALSSTSFCNGDSVILQAATASGNRYSWYKNNSQITSSSSYEYVARQAGTYLTKVTSIYGCSKQSNSIVVTVPCRIEEELETGISKLNNLRLYPNPSSDVVYLEFENGNTDKNLVLTVYDSQGRIVSANFNKNGEGRWMLDNLDAGVYLLKADDGEASITRTFFIIK